MKFKMHLLHICYLHRFYFTLYFVPIFVFVGNHFLVLSIHAHNVRHVNNENYNFRDPFIAIFNNLDFCDAFMTLYQIYMVSIHERWYKMSQKTFCF